MKIYKEYTSRFNRSKYNVGDYIIITSLPAPPHWLNYTNRRIFRLTHNPVMFGGELMWCTSGTHNYNIGFQGYGIHENFFRKATPEEIERFLPKPRIDDPYCEEIWDE